MNRRNQNKPYPFPGSVSYEATKPGIFFLRLFCVVVGLHFF